VPPQRTQETLDRLPEQIYNIYKHAVDSEKDNLTVISVLANDIAGVYVFKSS
jgi:hypothetical protein